MGISSVAERSVTKLQELPSPDPPTAGRGDPRARRVRGLPILGHKQLRCNMVQYHNEGGPGIGCEKREGAGVCGQLHHRLLHSSRSAHVSANAVAGLPRGQEGFRQDWFSGKPTGSLLTEGTSGAIFKILEAPVVSTEGKKILNLVFIDPGSNINFITHELAGQLQLFF